MKDGIGGFVGTILSLFTGGVILDFFNDWGRNAGGWRSDTGGGRKEKSASQQKDPGSEDKTFSHDFCWLIIA